MLNSFGERYLTCAHMIKSIYYKLYHRDDEDLIIPNEKKKLLNFSPINYQFYISILEYTKTSYV